MAVKANEKLTPRKGARVGSKGKQTTVAVPAAGVTPVKTAELNLESPATDVQALLLRANVPTVVTLSGPADLLFGAFTVALTARSLVRDMALADWGTAKSLLDDSMEYLLPGLTRIESVSVAAPKGSEAELLIKRNGEFDTEEPVDFPLKASGGTMKGSRVIAFETDSVRLTQPSTSAALSLFSASVPSRIGISIGDDSPLQVFATGMAVGGAVTSRELASQVNAAWRKAAAVGALAQVAMKLTSQTDGLVDLAIAGSWGRFFAGPTVPLTLNPVHPGSLAAAWPFGAGPLGAAVTLRLTGSLSRGKRLKLVPAGADFTVRVQEQMEVAQAVLIAPPGATATARQVTAVWLFLPSIPSAEEQLELRIAAAEGDPAAPADTPLLRTEILLPADALAYLSAGGGYWYRAALDKPADLDGAQVSQPLFLVAAGRGAGTLLCHRHTGPLPAGGSGAGRVPALPVGAGSALVRNLGRTGSWELQGFSRRAAAWVMDLELAPLPDEYPALVTATLAGKPPVAVGFAGAGESAVEVQWPNVAPTGTVGISLESGVMAALTARVTLYRAIK